MALFHVCLAVWDLVGPSQQGPGPRQRHSLQDAAEKLFKGAESTWAATVPGMRLSSRLLAPLRCCAPHQQHFCPTSASPAAWHWGRLVAQPWKW